MIGVSSTPSPALSVEGQAHRLIDEATCKERLGSMYVWYAFVRIPFVCMPLESDGCPIHLQESLGCMFVGCAALPTLDTGVLVPFSVPDRSLERPWRLR